MTGPDSPSGFQTQKQLQALLAAAGIRPRRKYGQHFLIDRNLLGKLIEAAELRGGDLVVEVGAGAGGLTAELAARAGWVVAIEIDPGLAGIAESYLADRHNVTLLRGDALQSKSAISPELESVLRQALARGSGDLKLVANLPYDIATPLLLNLLVGDLPFRRCCFTVQAEVADRFLAEPGSAEYGPVSVVSQYFCRLRRVVRVPPQAFWPIPQVESAMLRMDPRPDPNWPSSDRAAFAALVRACFNYRRKTLGHSVRRLDPSGRLLGGLEAAGIDPSLRPEDIDVARWVRFFLATR